MLILSVNQFLRKETQSLLGVPVIISRALKLLRSLFNFCTFISTRCSICTDKVWIFFPVLADFRCCDFENWVSCVRGL